MVITQHFYISLTSYTYYMPSKLILNITGHHGLHTTFLHINDIIYLLHAFKVILEHRRTSWSSHNISTYHCLHIPTISLHSRYWTSQDIMVITQHFYISLTSYTYYMPSKLILNITGRPHNISTYYWHHIPTKCLQS